MQEDQGENGGPQEMRLRLDRMIIPIIWNWDNHGSNIYNEAYFQHSGEDPTSTYDDETRAWDVGMIVKESSGLVLAYNILTDAAKRFRENHGLADLPEIPTMYDYNRHRGIQKLAWAASYGNESMVIHLIRRGTVDIEGRTQNHQTALSLASENGLHEMVHSLMSQGRANINTQDRFGRTPLMLAILAGHRAVLKELLNHVPDLEVRDTKGDTVLWYACSAGDLHTANTLLDHYIEQTSLKPKDIGNSLLEAVKNNHSEVARLLLERYENLESQFASSFNNDPTRKGHHISALVQKCFSQSNFDIRHINLEVVDKEKGRTPFLWAVITGNESIVKMLLDTDQVDINRRDKKSDDMTPLMEASELGHSGIVKLLLQRKDVAINTTDRSKHTALWYAVRVGMFESVKLLLETGSVDVDKGPRHSSPLQVAKSQEREDLVKILEQHGASTSE